jgi:hypothetical protein
MGGLHQSEANMPKSKSTTQPGTTAAPPPEAQGPKGKLGVLVELLSRPEGATLADMQAATGWQAHSVRGAIAGSIKKKLGRTVTSEKIDGQRRYRIAEAAGDAG